MSLPGVELQKKRKINSLPNPSHTMKSMIILALFITNETLKMHAVLYPADVLFEFYIRAYSIKPLRIEVLDLQSIIRSHCHMNLPVT